MVDRRTMSNLEIVNKMINNEYGIDELRQSNLDFVKSMWNNLSDEQRRIIKAYYPNFNLLSDDTE